MNPDSALWQVELYKNDKPATTEAEAKETLEALGLPVGEVQDNGAEFGIWDVELPNSLTAGWLTMSIEVGAFMMGDYKMEVPLP